MRYKAFVLILLTCISYSVTAQDILGQWKTIDDETGEEKSIVEVYEHEGKIFGKIIEIINPLDRDALCKKCEGDEYNNPIKGLVLLKNMIKSGNSYINGTIFDPERGKKYKCKLTLDRDNPNVLRVRGYIAFLYSTQYWVRIKS